MDKIETFDNIVNRIKNYEQAMTPPGVPLRHMDEIYKEAAEQYAAQQAQEITDVGQSGQYWGDQWVKMRERAERAEKQLDEVKRLRDEAAELLHSICMMLHDGDLVANSHTNDTYIRNKISKTIKAAGFLSQLENENKDE